MTFCASLKIAIAQTVVWQMRPIECDKIQLINSDLYRIEKNGKIGLVRSDGTFISPIENDNISSFYEGKALVTSNDGDGERINAVLTEDGKYNQFSKIYHTLNGQKFFSNGLLSVSNEKGELGYIDEYGSEVCAFNGKYDRIKPFAEGYATVFKNKKYHLINKEGIPVKFTFKSVGEVYGGTNVYNGLAYVWDTEGRFYTFDVNKNNPCKSVKTPPNTKALDYLYRFTSVSGQDKKVPFKDLVYKGKSGIQPSTCNGKYGYCNSDNFVLPYQFSVASQFEDGYAIVGENGKLGIIKYVDGSSFSVMEVVKSLMFQVGKSVTCKFSVDIPEAWKNKNLHVEMKDQQGALIETVHVDNVFSFQQTLNSNCKRDFYVTISGDGLLLFEGKLVYNYTKIVDVCPICGKEKGKCLGHNKPKEKEDKCHTCGLKISECKYQGVH